MNKLKFALLLIFLLMSCQDEQNYSKAKEIFNDKKITNFQEEALKLLTNINRDGSFYKSHFQDIINLNEKIIENYTVAKRDEICKEYEDTKILFIDNEDNSLKVMQLGNQIEQTITSKSLFNGYIKRARWSPNGDWIAFQAEEYNSKNLNYPGDSIYLISRNGSQLKRLTHQGGDEYPSWSPDGNKILFNRKSNTILSIDIDTEEEKELFPKKEYEEFSGYYPMYLKNNKDIVFNRKGSFQLLKEGESEPIDLISEAIIKNPNDLQDIFTGLTYWFPILSHSGDKIAIEHKGITIFNILSYEALIIGNGFYMSWSPDDRYLLINDYKESKNAFFIIPLEKNEIVPNLNIIIGYGKNAQWSIK